MAKAPAKIVKSSEEDEAQPDNAAELPQPGKKPIPGKMIVLYAGAALLVLLIGGGTAAYFMGMFDSQDEAHADSAKEEEAEQKAVFYDLPEILVNLNSSGKKETYLKIRIALELENGEILTDLEPLMPRVIDNFQVFLREMRVEDISGSAGMIRLKEEMLQRINLSVAPLKVKDVLFKEMLIQ